MLVLKILGVIGACVGIATAIWSFDIHCETKFGHRFLTKGSMAALIVAVGLAMLGSKWYDSALHSHGDPWNGRILMILAGLIVISLIVVNMRRTGLIYGALGTALQLSAVPFVVYFGFLFFILWFVFMMIVTQPTPVYVVNQNS